MSHIDYDVTIKIKDISITIYNGGIYILKALATDFDGTLFFSSLTPCFKSKDLNAIHDFQSRGNWVGVCTGRPIEPILDDIGKRIQLDFYILSNGALVLNKKQQPLYKRLLDYETIHTIHEQYHDHCVIYLQSTHSLYATQRQKTNFRVKVHFLDHIENAASMEICGCSLVFTNADQAQRAYHSMKTINNSYDFFQNVNCIDIVPKDCSKGNGLKVIKQSFGIEIAGGIGDSFNDIPLLDEADVAFTFHNSVQQVQDHADILVNDLADTFRYL